MMLDFKSGRDPRFENPLIRQARLRRLGLLGAIATVVPAMALGWLLLPGQGTVPEPTPDATATIHTAPPRATPQISAARSTDQPAAAATPRPQPGTTAAIAPVVGAAEPTPPKAAKAAVVVGQAQAKTTAPTASAKAPAPQAPKQAPADPVQPRIAVVGRSTATTKKAEQPKTKTVRYRIKRGETLASIFKKLGIPKQELHQMVRSGKQGRKLANIMPGQELRILFDQGGDVRRLVLQRDPVHSLVIESDDDGGYKARSERRDVQVKRRGVSGTIASSLFEDARKAGLSDAQILELAGLFNWDIDFALQLRAGDSFRVVFEEQYLGDKKYRNGPILAAEFTNRGQIYRAIRFEDDNGVVDYYDPKGHGKRRAFIRTPLKVGRISSRFSKRRWHPVLKRWRSHKGVDYAAPRGTPVKVTGAGKVIFRGRKGGYGRVVIVQHGNKYQTLYAHLNAFSGKVQRGSKVRQGQIIGYVGSSGLASGPHLHYEFRVNGRHKDPLRVKLPKNMRLSKKERSRFRHQAAPLVALLDAVPSKTMVASAGKDKPKAQ